MNKLLLLLPLALLACGAGDKDADVALDTDGDGISDNDEAELGTDPNNEDSDGDGISDGDEQEQGTDPLSEDTDEDGIADGDELELGSDPTSSDTDEDGLSDGEELSLGTDPTDADTDGDSFTDSEELDAGNLPLNRYNWPTGTGQWPDFSEEVPEAGTGYAMGEVFPNFTATDQYDGSVDLYQFYGSVILLDFSAGWCNPCRDFAQDAQELWMDNRDDGLIIIHAMTDNNSGGPPYLAFLEAWAGDYGLEFPVLGGKEDPFDAIYEDLYSAGLNGGYVPYVLLLDSEMRISAVHKEGVNESQLRSQISTLLDELAVE